MRLLLTPWLVKDQTGPGLAENREQEPQGSAAPVECPAARPGPHGGFQMAEAKRRSSVGARPTVARRALDDSPPLEACMSDDGDLPPTAFDAAVEHLCREWAEVGRAILARRKARP